MSEEQVPGRSLKNMGWFLVISGFFGLTWLPNIAPFCCVFGLIGIVAGMVSSSGPAVSSDGRMVLKQDNTGQWSWVEQGQAAVQDVAASHNDQSNQILSRLIQQVRGGKPLEELQTTEVDVLANAYGIQSGSNSQKINALKNSDAARTGLQLGAIAGVAGIAGVATSKIVESGRQRALDRAEELRQQGRDKLMENIEEGKYKIDSSLPKSESGESASEIANNVITDQITNLIRSKNLTPEMLLSHSDGNNDGVMNAVEISAAIGALIGMTVPVFIVKDSIKQFDLDEDGTLNIHELNSMWEKLGFDVTQVEDTIDEETESDSEEIELPPEEVVTEQVDEIEVEVPQTSEPETILHDEPVKQEINAQQEEIADVISEGIDTELEHLILQMEDARFSSERKEIMQTQESDFTVQVKIDKIDRTLIGDSTYRGGQSVHGLIDGGPYSGLLKMPAELNDLILTYKIGDVISVKAKLIDFSPSLKRPVLEGSSVI
tara:strand:+ start:800 stop:2269 length:1470 start_codon:yes stop_codon:yes gene_type:complete